MGEWAYAEINHRGTEVLSRASILNSLCLGVSVVD